MKEDFKLFIDQWQSSARMGAEIFLGLALVIIVFYLIALLFTTNLAKKYKFMSKNEIPFLWYTALSLTLSFMFLLNSLIIHRLNTYQSFELVLKSVLSLGLALAIGSFFNTYIKIYYQFTLDRRLANVRFKPRTSSTGKAMKLLNEEEEDKYMTAEMIAQEEAYTFDYDVWLDEETGETLTEKYDGNLHALICDNCKFRTLKIVSEEIERSATATSPGSVKKYFKCSHCGREDIKHFEMPPLNA